MPTTPAPTPSRPCGPPTSGARRRTSASSRRSAGARRACYHRGERHAPGEARSMKKYQLMAPGPTPVPSEVLLAMAQPMIHHRTPEYDAPFAEVRAGLKTLFQTEQEVLPLAG